MSLVGKLYYRDRGQRPKLPSSCWSHRCALDVNILKDAHRNTIFVRDVSSLWLARLGANGLLIQWILARVRTIEAFCSVRFVAMHECYDVSYFAHPKRLIAWLVLLKRRQVRLLGSLASTVRNGRTIEAFYFCFLCDAGSACTPLDISNSLLLILTPATDLLIVLFKKAFVLPLKELWLVRTSIVCTLRWESKPNKSQTVANASMLQAHVGAQNPSMTRPFAPRRASHNDETSLTKIVFLWASFKILTSSAHLCDQHELGNFGRCPLSL
jgi:hypothetical protein